MKKYSRGMASFVVMMMLSPVAAQAADGKVTFNGEVIENTCTVVNKDKTVTLPTVQRSALSSAGETAGVVPFTIDLTSCTPGADVSVYFEKDQYVSTEGRLKNTLSDGTEAENVDVELLNTRFTPINLAESPAVAADGTIARPDVIPVAVAEQDGSASLPFYARYYATDASTAGKVATYVNITVYPPGKEEVNMRRMVLAWLLSCILPSADASMVIDGTRIIFPGDNKEIAVRATNMGETPSLTQVWVDDGRVQNQPEKDSAPFIVLPPIVRIEPGKGQSWRLVFNGSRLPQDRESLFWFNLLDIPPEPKNGTAINYLQLAIRSRIKLFYRPAGVAAEKMAPENALRWALAPTGNGLRVSNASSRYITIDSITLNGQKQSAGMVAPFSSLEIALKGVALRTLPEKFSFTTINDYGAVVNHNYPQ